MAITKTFLFESQTGTGSIVVCSVNPTFTGGINLVDDSGAIRMHFESSAGIDANIGLAATGNDRMLIGWSTSHYGYLEAGSTTNPIAIQGNGGRVLIGTYTDDGATRLQILQGTLGNQIISLKSTATNDDPEEKVYQNRVATTDATVTTLHTFTIPASTTYMIKAMVAARRTGGAAGTAEDGASYEMLATYKNVAGTATLIGAPTIVANEDQAGWDCVFDVTGATARIRVTGAVDNSITWHVTARVYSLST